MGWTWALFFANEGTTACATTSHLDFNVRDRQRVPRLVKGSALSAVYVDNLTTVGGNRSDTVAGVERFIDEADRKRLLSKSRRDWISNSDAGLDL